MTFHDELPETENGATEWSGEQLQHSGTASTCAASPLAQVLAADNRRKKWRLKYIVNAKQRAMITLKRYFWPHQAKNDVCEEIFWCKYLQDASIEILGLRAVAKSTIPQLSTPQVFAAHAQ